MPASFSPSINIERDQNVSRYYHPTPNSINAYDTIANNFKSGIHSYNIIGSYGTGKSAFLLAFTKHLKKSEKVFSPVGKRFNNCKSFNFINLVGKYQSIIEIFAEQFDVDADEDLILKKIQQLQKKAKTNNECIVIVFDEFGKALEYSAKNNPERDLYFIQRLSEYVNNQKRNILFISTLHQNFDAYSIGLSERDRKEWEKVKGRLKEIPFNEPVEQLLNLASKVISEKFSPKNKAITKRLLNKVVKYRLFGLQSEVIESISKGLYPLDILAASCLVVSLQKYGQNERSLFNFIESEEPFSIKEFLRKETRIYNVADVYDYLILNFSYILSSKHNSDFFGWKLLKDSLDRVDTQLDEYVLECKAIVKVVGLLGLSISGKGKVNVDFLVAYAKEVLGIRNAKEAVELLQEVQIIRYHKYKDSFTLFEGSDIDIEKEIDRKKRQVGLLENMEFELLKHVTLEYEIAKRVTYEKGTPRIFKYKVTGEKLIEENFEKGRHDGVVNIYFREQEFTRAKSQLPILHCNINDLDSLYEIVYNLYIVDKILFENTLDSVGRIEIQDYKEFLVRRLNVEFYGGIYSDRAKWSYRGKPINIDNVRELNKQLSKISERVYSATPSFRNEMVNKSKLSGSIHGAKKQYTQALITNWNKPNLGFEGYKVPPERTIYNTLLAKSGIHYSSNDMTSAFQKPTDLSYSKLWNKCEEFIEESKSNPRKIEELLNQLRLKPFGLKEGFLEFWIITFLFIKREDYALYYDGVYQPSFSKEVCEVVLKKSKIITIKAIEVEGLKLDLFNNYRQLVEIGDKETITNKGFQEIAKPFLVFYKKLSKFSKLDTLHLSPHAIKLRKVLLNAKELEKTFFEDIPQVFNLNVSSLSADDGIELTKFIEQVELAIKELRTSDQRLKDRFKERLCGIFQLESGNFESLRDNLISRYTIIKPFLLDKRQTALIKRMSSQIPDENAYFNSLAQGFMGKPLTDLEDQDEIALYHMVSKQLEEFDNLLDISGNNIDYKKEKAIKISIYASDGENSERQLILNKKQIAAIDKQKMHLSKFLGAIDDPKVIEGLLIQTLKELNNGE